MRILPTRKMRLAGQHIDQGIPVDVPADQADLAIRNGWAIALPMADGKPAQAIEPARKRRAKTDA